MPVFTNDAALKAQLQKDVEKIVLQVTEKVESKVVEIVQEKVYDDFDEHNRISYSPLMKNGGFLGAWNVGFENDILKISGDTISSRVFYDWESMELHQGDGRVSVPVHGSSIGGKWDVRESLADIFETGNPKFGQHFGDGWWTQRRKFWTEVLKKINKQWIEKEVESEFKKNKVEFVKGVYLGGFGKQSSQP